jgi:hypothetical protein
MLDADVKTRLAERESDGDFESVAQVVYGPSWTLCLMSGAPHVKTNCVVPLTTTAVTARPK